MTPQPRDIAAEVMAVIREQYDLNEVTPASVLKNINGHALDLFLIIAIEDRFGIEITDEEAERVRTVMDLIALVVEGKSPRGAHPDDARRGERR